MAAYLRHGDRLGVTLCLLAGLAFAAQPVIVNLAYDAGAAVPAVLAWRYLLAAVALAVIARRGVRRMPVRVAATAFGLGLVVYAADSALFFWALRLVPVPVASLLHYAHLPLVIGGAVLLRHEVLSRRRVFSGVLVLCGVALVSGGAGALDVLGVTVAFGAAVAYGVYVLVSGRLVSGSGDPLAFAALMLAGAATSFTVGAAVDGSLTSLGGGVGVAAVVETALVGSVIAVGAFLAGMRRVGASRASLLFSCDGPLGDPHAAVVSALHVALPLPLGAAVVLVGIGSLQVRRRPVLRLLRGGRADAGLPVAAPAGELAEAA
jgi:drug/metabolite transporter (DMT)-like permease